MERRCIIIAPPPTPNGDLHIGHMAGPYLAGDIHARYRRAKGDGVIFTTGTDDSQTYVVTSARKKGLDPEVLCDRSWHEIRASLNAMGVAVDGFAPFDDGYRNAVLNFLAPLYRAGKFESRQVRFPYGEQSHRYLIEAFVSGICPVCLAESRGGLCETCGHPNNFDELLDPRSNLQPGEPVSFREVTILVLPLERYRAQIEAHYATYATMWRPHIKQLLREVLSAPLPDFPITYPTEWGIRAPYPETPAQVINAWVEGMPASMYCTAFSAKSMGFPEANWDSLWMRETGNELVYFLGFDNSYFWALTHLALLFAHGDRYIKPSSIVCNEFYELEHEKFSTSRGHLIWATDLVKEVPRDLVRFYLAMTAPEHQRTNFSRSGMVKVVSDRLIRPWNQLAASLSRLMTHHQIVPGAVLPVLEDARRCGTAMLRRFDGCYALPSLSLERLADMLCWQAARLAGLAAQMEYQTDAGALGGLFYQVILLVKCAAPVLVDTCGLLFESSWLDHHLPEKAVASEAPALKLPTLPAFQESWANPSLAAHRSNI